VHAVTDAQGRPVVLVLTAGNVSDYVPAKACLEAAPQTEMVIADRGYDSDELRNFIKRRGATPVIPPKKNRKVQYHYDKEIYKTRNRVERFFCRLKDFRRVATTYDRQPYMFLAAVFLAAIVAFWI
jgi:transposase